MVDMPHIRFGKESGGYEFPTTDGTAGQVLGTNGAGKLSWSAMTAAGGWTDAGAIVQLSNVNDSVGIGTWAPGAKLSVAGASAQGQMGGALFGVSGIHVATLNYGSLGTNVYGAYGRHNVSTNYGALGTSMAGVYGNSSAGFAGYFDGKAYIGGRLGIGTTMALNQLDVEGGAAIGVNYSSSYSAPTNGLLVEGRIGVGKTVPSVQVDLSDMMRIGGATWPGVGTGEGLELAYDASTNRGFIQPYDRNASSRGDLCLLADGVGINETDPTAMLQIRGYQTWENPHIKLSESQNGDSRIIHGGSGLQFRNFYALPGNMAFDFLDKNNNHLLFVNADGEVGIPGRATVGGQTYLEAITLSHDGTNGKIETWTGDINMMPAANVGIGTADPQDKLEVKGNVRLDNGAGSSAALRFTDGGTQKWAFVLPSVGFGKAFVHRRYWTQHTYDAGSSQ